jgi:hypothetical protein
MKKQNLFLLAIIICTAATAQKEPQTLNYNKKDLDSLFGTAQKYNQLFIVPGIPEQKKKSTIDQNFILTPKAFEELNAGSIVINKTTRGTIYNMSLDNMAVLVPNMSRLEKMPGSNKVFKIAPLSNMPNPLYPQVYPKKKQMR